MHAAVHAGMFALLLHRFYMGCVFLRFNMSGSLLDDGRWSLLACYDRHAAGFVDCLCGCCRCCCCAGRYYPCSALTSVVNSIVVFLSYTADVLQPQHRTAGFGEWVKAPQHVWAHGRKQVVQASQRRMD